MAVEEPSSAQTLRHLACCLAALNPAPWAKVRLNYIDSFSPIFMNIFLVFIDLFHFHSNGKVIADSRHAEGQYFSFLAKIILTSFDLDLVPPLFFRKLLVYHLHVALNCYSLDKGWY